MAARTKGTSLETIEAFLKELSHPLLDEIHDLRDVILGSDPAIGEAIKWSAPSFHTSEHFATTRLNGKPALQLILHLGAKKGVLPAGAIKDPGNLLKWLGPDRACITFDGHGSVSAVSLQLQEIIRQWLIHVPGHTA